MCNGLGLGPGRGGLPAELRCGLRHTPQNIDTDCSKLHQGQDDDRYPVPRRSRSRSCFVHAVKCENSFQFACAGRAGRKREPAVLANMMRALDRFNRHTLPIKKPAGGRLTFPRDGSQFIPEAWPSGLREQPLLVRWSTIRHLDNVRICKCSFINSESRSSGKCRFT